MTIILDSVPDLLTKPAWFAALEPSRMMVEMGALALATPLLVVQRAETGRPFLIVTGALSTNFGTNQMRQVLKMLGHHPHTPHTWTMFNKPEKIFHIVKAKTDYLYERYEQPITLMGWCAGGVFTRMTAHAIPDKVRQVINMGSARSGPTYDPLSPKHLRYTGREPLPVPSTVIYSRTDGLNDWRNVVEDPGPQSENIEVFSSHLGMANHPHTLHILADRLAQPLGQRAPYKGMTSTTSPRRRRPVRVADPGDASGRGRLPAALEPLAQVRALDAERGVGAVPGVDPGVVVVHVEDPLGDVGIQGLEALARVLGVSDPPREKRVPCEQMGVPVRVGVRERDRAGGVPAQVQDVELDLAEPDPVAVHQPSLRATGRASASSSPAIVTAPVDEASAANAWTWSWWRWVVTMVPSRPVPSSTSRCSRSASAAASTSSCSPDARQVSR